MKIKSISSLLLTSLLVISCSNSTNSIVETNVGENINTNSFSSYSKVKGKIDDMDIGANRPNMNLINSKFQNETSNIESDSKFLSFKTTLVKKGKNLISSKADSFKVSGIVNYPDDKGKLKEGRNLTLTVLSNGKQVAQANTDDKGFWSVNLDKSNAGKTLNISFQFSNKLWNITGKSKSYKWDLTPISNLSTDIDTGIVSPVQGSESAKAAFIHDIFNRYLDTFSKEGVDISWWNRQLKTIWPGDGNYYSWGTLNLTNAEHWDVNGHEIGHAMTDLGTNSQMGGGQHKIDECYEKTIAWSEGFASFLSSVVSLSKNDEDAKFEFLVPRRAPIRIENVPDDVCKGQTNEWRVSAAMWDLYDTHEDGLDNSGIPFKTLWSALSRSNKSIGSMQDAANSLKEVTSSEFNTFIDNALKQNTIN